MDEAPPTKIVLAAGPIESAVLLHAIFHDGPNDPQAELEAFAREQDARVARLEAENARLREALQTIENARQ